MTRWRRYRGSAAGVGLLACILTTEGQAMPRDVIGRWETNGGTSHIDIQPCGAASRCGQIVWMSDLHDDEGKPKRDHNNPDSAKRQRTLLGLELLGDFTADEKNDEWSGGWIYNPRDGQHYRAILKRLGENELMVRGFVGLRLFGSSRIWRRVPGDGARPAAAGE